MELTQNLGPAFLLTLLAGLSTGIGSAIAWFIRTPKMKYLSFSLGLSAGVMVYVSFMELLPEAIAASGEKGGILIFFGGIFFAWLIDMIMPNTENPHHGFGDAPPEGLMRMGIFTACALGIHNFPEGLATFATTLGDLRTGLIVAFAIAIHNIPEGISVSMPIFYATGSRRKAFTWSFSSGLAEPLGALVGFWILRPFLTQALLAGLLAFVAGIMIYIALDELLPTAHRYGQGHEVISGLILGMAVMAGSLMIL